MSSLSHSFDVNIAQEHGIHEAILIHHFQYWIHFNKRLKKNEHEGRTWSYQSIQDIAAHFPYLSKKQVERTLVSLVKKKILKKGNFNKSKYDRTCWYCFQDEELYGISRIREMENLESGNENPQIGTPIPDAIPTSSKYPIVPKGTPPSSKRVRVKEDKQEVAPSVQLTMNQQKDIFRRLQGTSVTPEMCYDKLSQWKIKKGIAGGSDYSSILKWVITAVKTDLSRPKPVDMTEENKKLAESIQKAFHGNPDIRHGYDYIEFDHGMHHPHIKFHDHGFREQVENSVRKLGLTLPG